jgi:hypothetical protein
VCLRVFPSRLLFLSNFPASIYIPSVDDDDQGETHTTPDVVEAAETTQAMLELTKEGGVGAARSRQGAEAESAPLHSHQD